MTNVIWKMENETASMTLNELARLIGAEARGDGEIELTGVGPLADAGAGEVTYVADAARLEERARESEAACLIVPLKLADHVALAGRRLLVAKDAKLAFARAIAAFHSKPYKARGVSSDLVLGENSRLGAECSIHPRVTIGSDSVVGDRVTLHPGVVIGDNCRVGDDTVIFANVSIYDSQRRGDRRRRIQLHARRGRPPVQAFASGPRRDRRRCRDRRQLLR
jgi:UDP-3-O-[3-hydroxymyristoyl] glucosamine N-acyltransferase